MRKVILAILLFSFINSNAQQNPAVVDSFKLQLKNAKTDDQKIDALSKLSRTLMSINMAEADAYAVQMTQTAELSRDRKLIIKALLINGERASYLGTKDHLAKSIEYYNKALELARKNKLDKEIAQSLLALSTVHAQLPDLEKALHFTNQASAVVSTLKNDSMQVVVYNSFGTVYQLKKDRLLSLRNYLNGLRIAEEAKDDDLLRKSYKYLSSFYADLKEYDKAIDYAVRSMEKLSPTKGNQKYQKVTELSYIGNLYAYKKNYDMSVYYYESSIKLADSLKYEALKVYGYTSILNQYILQGEPQKALEYFNGSAEMKRQIYNYGLPHIIDQAYGIIYSDLKRFDSANFYFKKAEPAFEAKGTAYDKLHFYAAYGTFFKRSGNIQQAVAYYQKAKTVADGTANLEWQEEIAKNLDTLYTKSGNHKLAYQYNSLHHQYKDSLSKLGEEKDVLQMELADEQQRQDRLSKEKQAALDRKHNVQYMGITIAIATVFVLLVLLGAFQVSVTTIKILGFFAFIFLFEFIILIADAKIHHWTHGEPLPIIAIKVVLIALLLPLHHWLEHKVVGYLLSRKMILPSGKNIWTKVLAKRAARQVQ